MISRPSSGRWSDGAASTAATAQRARVLELVGPAGAGKSTVARRLRDRIGGTRPSFGLWGLPTRLLASNAARLLPTFAGFLRDGRPRALEELAQMIRLDALHDLVQQQRALTRGLVVLDEGPVFAFSWMEVFYPERGGPRWAAWRQRRLAAWARTVDLIVLLDAPDPVLTHRMRTREKSHPVKHSPDAEIHAFTASFRAAFDRVIAELAAQHGPRLLTISTADETSDHTVERLLTMVQRSGGDG